MYKSKYKNTFVGINIKNYSMKITTTGSLGNVGKPLAKLLLAQGHEVTIVSSNDDRVGDIVRLGATPAIGSLTDGVFLKTAFADADAVFAMTPPNLGLQHIVANTVAAGRHIATAIQETGVKRVVLLSSIGADLPEGNGPIASLYAIEGFYREPGTVATTFLRAGYFYTNFFNDIPLIKHAGIQGGNLDPDTRLPLVHPEDIALAAAEELTGGAATTGIRYIVSDVRTPHEVAAALGAAIGKPDLPWVSFSDEENEQGMLKAGVPAEIAALYTELGSGLREQKVQNDFLTNDHPATGKVKLADFAREFALRYQG